MKKIIFLTILCTSISPAIAWQLGAKDNGLKEFYQLRTFKDVSQSILTESENSAAVEKLVKKVGAELSKKFEEKYSQGESEPINFDFCSSKCTEYGARSQMKQKLEIGFAFSPTEEAQQCQKVCKAYQLESYAYIDGIRYSERQKSASEDCSAASVSSGRSLNKEKVIDAISKEFSKADGLGIQK